MPIIEALEDPTPFENKTVPKGTRIRMLPDYAEARVKTGRWKYVEEGYTAGEKRVAEHLGVDIDKKAEEVAPKKAATTTSKKKVKA